MEQRGRTDAQALFGRGFRLVLILGEVVLARSAFVVTQRSCIRLALPHGSPQARERAFAAECGAALTTRRGARGGGRWGLSRRPCRTSISSSSTFLRLGGLAFLSAAAALPPAALRSARAVCSTQPPSNPRGQAQCVVSSLHRTAPLCHPAAHESRRETIDTGCVDRVCGATTRTSWGFGSVIAFSTSAGEGCAPCGEACELLATADCSQP